MLEQAKLYVAPWGRAAGDPAWTRTIADASDRPLGFVRFAGRTKPSWLSWVRGVQLEVFETDDASHLMTLVRPWSIFRIWDVYDADERRIGSVYPPSLIDTEGERQGYLDVRDRHHGAILDRDRCIAATFHRQPSSALEVVFTTDRVDNPFLRMLLLASVLMQEPSPPR